MLFPLWPVSPQEEKASRAEIGPVGRGDPLEEGIQNAQGKAALRKGRGRLISTGG